MKSAKDWVNEYGDSFNVDSTEEAELLVTMIQRDAVKGLSVIPGNETKVYKAYLNGIVTAEECNTKLRELGYTFSVREEYDANGCDTTTGLKRRA